MIECTDKNIYYKSMVYSTVGIGWYLQYIVLNPYTQSFDLVDYLDKSTKPATPLVETIQPDTSDFVIHKGSQLLKLKHFCETNGHKFVDVKQSVFFAFASSKIDSKKEELNIKAYAKAAADAGVKLRVVGFADTIGSEAYNQTLSLNRAEAVAEMLRANGAEVETVLGQGESSEYSTKFLNRRVIIEVAQ